jgi:peptidyl-prolyl cis-trans isomerase SurA
MRKCIFLTACLLFLASGCDDSDKPKFTDQEMARIPLAKRDGLPEASGGFVLVVGGEAISSDDLIAEPLLEHFRPIARKSSLEQFKKLARPDVKQLLETRISNILLYQQAKRDAGTGADFEDALEKATESEVRRFIVSFKGDYAKAEQALKQMGMDWKSFREYQKKMILSQEYIRQLLPEHGPITYSELVNCYNEMKDESFATPATITFRLIDIQIPKLKVTDPNRSQREQAEELANELVKRLQKGEDFGELAKQYSHDYKASSGGLWQPVQPQSLAKPYDVLAAEAEKIQPGQIAGPIEANEHIFIMKLEEKKPKDFEPLENVQEEVEAKITFDRRKKAFEEFNSKLVQQVELSEREKFMDFCLEKIFRRCRQ